MTKRYTEQELIDELHRFVRENGRVPTAPEMTNKDGYPSYDTYKIYFGSWNNALLIAGFEVNQTHKKLIGNETCCICGEYLKTKQNWHTKGLSEGQVMCQNCYQEIYQKPDYKNGKLNKNSETGKATVSQRIVFNVLNLEEKYDCNCTYGFDYFVDLYHKGKYKYINVKDSKLHNSDVQSPYWKFNLIQEVIPDTYIMLGYDENRKNILKVWITDVVDDLVYDEKKEELKKSLFISDIYESLKRAKPWEVNAKPYNDMLHKMSEKRKQTNGKECFLSDDDLVIE